MRIGDRTITTTELTERMTLVPPYQLARMGRTPDGIRQMFLVPIIETALLVEGAKSEGLDRRPDIAHRLAMVERGELLHALRREVLAEAAGPNAVTDADVEAYYEANKTRFQQETLIKLWRIIADSKATADKVLQAVQSPEFKKDPKKEWDKLVREHSIDEFTKKRQGSLGFIRSDGSTKSPYLEVSPEVYRAAEKVEDGQFVPQPLQVGDDYMVLWRRETKVTPERPLRAVSGQIRQMLVEEKVADHWEQLLERLRREHLSEYVPERVDIITEVRPGEVEPKKRPGVMPLHRHPSAASPRPTGRSGRMR